MNERAEGRAQIEATRDAAAKIRADIEANENALVDILAARIGRLFSEAQELNTAMAVLLQMRKRGR